jgi:acyl dehydratase
MPVAYERLLSWPIPAAQQRLDDRELMLYALGVGVGQAPEDPGELRFTYEDGLAMLPTMASILAHPGLWMSDPDLGVDWQRLLHGEQGIRIHAPLPVEGVVTGESRVTDVIDRGAGKGALVYQERQIRDDAGRHVATATWTTFARGDGGCGGPAKPTPRPHVLPDRAPDRRVALPTLPQQHLIYRLLGDRHPIHADPAFARDLGFDGPILAGLCTYGVAGHALLKSVCPEPGRLAAMDARFSAPAYPGETIVTEIWAEGGGIYGFRARASARDVVVLDNGRAEVAES